MKLSRYIGVGAFLLAATLVMAQGAKVDGSWKTQTKSARGNSEQTMTLKQTGATFAGEMVTAQGDKQAIKDGTITGNDIEFTITRPQGDVQYKGTVSGDSMSGTFKGASGAEVQWTATRSM